MDHTSIQLMEDYSVNGINMGKTVTDTTTAKQKNENGNPLPPSKVKMELQTLRISKESEHQLYDTLKHIYGPSFKLSDASEFESKRSNLNKQYWTERGNLVIKGIVNYSSKDATPKTEEQITRQFAISKLQSYGFHQCHCIEALVHTEGALGKALELLFYKYYRLQDIAKKEIPEDMDIDNFLERRSEEKEALESIYGNMFVEKIKNQIWIVQVKLDYLVRNDKVEEEIQRVLQQQEKLKKKEICRLFLTDTCKFGERCKFLHRKPQMLKLPEREDPYFTLEIRFPEGCKYPYEPPYFYFYKNEGVFSSIKCLRIGRRLHNEALSLCEDGIPSIFSVINLLEDTYSIKEYLDENKEQFLDENELLLQNETESEDEINVDTHYKLGSIYKTKRMDISSEEILKENNLIKQSFTAKQKSPEYRKMQEIRRMLPAWTKMKEILEVIRKHQVTIISGETGCGKSTQVPQYLLDDWSLHRSDANEHINIICTQPRRISAVGVAERVACERNESIGETVGYQIRLESKISNKTRLTFCTTGILLQRLSVYPELSNVTHVIVDEVHERNAESDFLLMLLKELLAKRSKLKIILMSATLKTEMFSSYFREAPVLYIPGKTFPVEQVFLEDIFERINYVLEPNTTCARRIDGVWKELEMEFGESGNEGVSTKIPAESVADENLSLAEIIGRYHGYSQRTKTNIYLSDPESLNFELIESTLKWIIFGEHNYPRTGSILIFLPGFAEIITLKDRLTVYDTLSLDPEKFIILPLHSSLPNDEQSLVFQNTGDIRKIVLSTNIAETSITIDDCVFVIDSGKMKEARFNSNENMESLETCWVSRANAMQRKGRAGRVMPGVCFYLYTSYRFRYHISAQPVAEILRIPLEPLLLRIQLLNRGKQVDLHEVLGKLLEAPSKTNISSAIKRLQDVGALSAECTMTPLGHHLAVLPVNVRIGKLILFGAIFCCLDSALTIAACLSHKNPFVIPYKKKQKTDVTKQFFTAYSDQLTILKAYKSWLEACRHSNCAGEVFANENYLSLHTLYTLADIKYQFLELLVSIGFVPVNLPKREPNVDKILDITGHDLNVNNENYKLLQGLLCAALYPNVAKVLTPEKSFMLRFCGAIPKQPKPRDLRFQTKDHGHVFIHPSSVNFTVNQFSSPYLAFQEKVKTSKIYIRGVSMVPIVPLILFSDYELKIEVHDEEFIISLEDGWILFSTESHKVAQLLQGMKTELVKLLEQKMKEPLLNVFNHPNGKKIIETIVNVVTRE